MIDLYTWTTPNGRKVSILLEELGLDYTVHPINIGQGEQFGEAFLEISPNNKIPAIVDHDGPDGEPLSVFESGAILIHLAEKTGRFLPAAGHDRAKVLEWLMFQMGGIGPFMGQAFHFEKMAPEDVPYARKRYGDELRRLLGVMDRRLAAAEYLAGDYSIADVATFPWVRGAPALSVDLDGDYANVARWVQAIEARPAVQRGLAVPQV
ncbi:MAG: glutathione S-transferase family protein [Alphaproteobacteria bacterium]|jgi:GST-like protein|nr:glutathione S-transferase family protein [Alphaproteobacteria bacterium]